jgi:hypothetical protein
MVTNDYAAHFKGAGPVFGMESYIAVPNYPNFGGRSFTISLWFKRANAGQHRIPCPEADCRPYKGA